MGKISKSPQQFAQRVERGPFLDFAVTAPIRACCKRLACGDERVWRGTYRALPRRPLAPPAALPSRQRARALLAPRPSPSVHWPIPDLGRSIFEGQHEGQRRWPRAPYRAVEGILVPRSAV